MRKKRRPYNFHIFNEAVRLFRRVQEGPRYRMTPFRKRIKQIRHTAAANLYWAKNPDKIPGFVGFVPGKGKSHRQKNYEFFMEHGDDILSSQGDDLDALAEHFDVDKHLPTQEKQEKVYQTMADTYIHGDPAWTKDRIVREKKHFLETLEKTHFPKLTCKLLGYDEKLVRTWMRTDFDFAENVRSCQLRSGERVAHAMLAKAITGDLGAQMYVLKQFGSSVNFLEPEVADVSYSAGGEVQVDKLTQEEQETLLRLLRKAQDDEVPVQQTEFIESEIPQQAIEAPPESVESPEEDDQQEPPVIEFSGD